jgi:hypothetical protein
MRKRKPKPITSDAFEDMRAKAFIEDGALLVSKEVGEIWNEVLAEERPKWAPAIYIGGGGPVNLAGKVLAVEGDVWTVELPDGRVIRRHRLNFLD